MPISTPRHVAAEYGGDEKHFEHVLETLFCPAVEMAGYEPVRPKSEGSDVIHAEIVKNLAESEMVLCDMTDLNANVFFELGIRTALDKPACHVRDQHMSRVAFDVSGVNYHTYDGKLSAWALKEHISELSSQIKEVAARTDEHNSMWQVFGLEAKAAEPTAEGSAVEAKLDLILNYLKTPQRSRSLPFEAVHKLEPLDGDELRLLGVLIAHDMPLPLTHYPQPHFEEAKRKMIDHGFAERVSEKYQVTPAGIAAFQNHLLRVAEKLT